IKRQIGGEEASTIASDERFVIGCQLKIAAVAPTAGRWAVDGIDAVGQVGPELLHVRCFGEDAAHPHYRDVFVSRHRVATSSIFGQPAAPARESLAGA